MIWKESHSGIVSITHKIGCCLGVNIKRSLANVEVTRDMTVDYWLILEDEGCPAVTTVLPYHWLGESGRYLSVGQQTCTDVAVFHGYICDIRRYQQTY